MSPLVLEIRVYLNKIYWERSHKNSKFFTLLNRLLAWSQITTSVNKNIVCFTSRSRLFV